MAVRGELRGDGPKHSPETLVIREAVIRGATLSNQHVSESSGRASHRPVPRNPVRGSCYVLMDCDEARVSCGARQGCCHLYMAIRVRLASWWLGAALKSKSRGVGTCAFAPRPVHPTMCMGPTPSHVSAEGV